MDKDILFKKCRSIVQKAYAPYSHFRVGAAILCSDGSIYTGINIENRSFGLTICAERVALFSAITQGHRDFVAMAVFCPDSPTPVPPCGACRQVISEFAYENFPIYYMDKNENIQTKNLDELLPEDSLHNLRKE